MVGTYDSLGKRPSASPQLGRPGTGEENLRGYAAMRLEETTYCIGPNVTDAASNRIVNGAAIGAVGALREVTRINAINGLPRVSLPQPMGLVVQLTANAAPTGTHAATIRITGQNQFGEPISEDFSVSAAAGGAGSNVLGVKPFAKISAVQVIAESNTSASDTLLVFFASATNAVFGLPMRIRDASDVVSIVAEVVGLSAFDIIQNGLGGSPATVSIKEQTIAFAPAVLSDALLTYMTVRTRTTIGMDQGYTRTPAGDKYQKNW